VVLNSVKCRIWQVVGHFNDPAHKPTSHQGHELSPELLVSRLSFVYLRGLCGECFQTEARPGAVVMAVPVSVWFDGWWRSPSVGVSRAAWSGAKQIQPPLPLRFAGENREKWDPVPFKHCAVLGKSERDNVGNTYCCAPGSSPLEKHWPESGAILPGARRRVSTTRAMVGSHPVNSRY